MEDDESGRDAKERIGYQDALVTALLKWLQRLAAVPAAQAILSVILSDTAAPWPPVPCGIQFLVRCTLYRQRTRMIDC